MNDACSRLRYSSLMTMPWCVRPIQGMLRSVGLRSETFGTPQEFLRTKHPDGPSCLVLDVRLPGKLLVVTTDMALQRRQNLIRSAHFVMNYRLLRLCTFVGLELQ